MKQANDERVLVIGAGPVGLCAALGLVRNGIPVLLVEAAAEAPEDLRASTFHPPTLDMLEEFDATRRLIAQGVIAHSWQIRFHKTGERVEFDLGLLKGSTGHPYRLQCEQRHLVAILREMLAAEPLAEIWLGAALVSLSQDADSVTATVDRAGELVEVSGRWLIGADGTHSAVRRGLEIGFEGKTYPEAMLQVVTTYDFSGDLEGLVNVNYVWADQANFSLMRVPGRWRCSFRPREGQTMEDALSEESVEAYLQGVVPRDQRYEVVAKAGYRVHQRVADHFRVGRVLLAGDAAHINSPNGGMGMNSGVHDAFNLVEKLTGVWRGEDAALLDRYGRQRKLVATQYVQQQSDKGHQRMRERDPVKRAEIMAELRRSQADPEQALAAVLKSSMIESLRFAEAIP